MPGTPGKLQQKRKALLRSPTAGPRWVFNKAALGISLAVQWLKLHASTAGREGSISGGGTKTLHAVWRGQKVKNK